MRLGNLTKAIAVAATVVWAAGCSTTSTTSDSMETSAADQAAQTNDSASAAAAGSDAPISSGSMTSGASAADQGMSQADVMRLSHVFYFDFDKAVIRPEALEDLNGHAAYLVENPSVRVVLEGHADERGTREYNMALGERRAKAVARYLTVQGVSPAQLEVVSYGEERPAVIGHNESAWSKNRRVEIKYQR